MSLDPRTVEGYIGRNAAHRSFKREIVNAKVLFLQIRGAREQLKAHFEKTISDARRSAPGSFSIGMITEVISPTQIGVLNIPHNEAELVVRDYDSLESQFNAILYCDLQRILEGFLLDLYAEIARKDSRVLISNRTVTFEEVLKTANLVELLLEKQLTLLSHADREGFEEQFAALGLSIASDATMSQLESDFSLREFRLLWGIRNVLQHNHGVVNALFMRKVQNSEYEVGDRIVIDAPKLSRAFAAVESISDDLNKRAIVKFDLSAA